MFEKQLKKIAEFTFPLQSALLGIYASFMFSAWNPQPESLLYIHEGRPAHSPRLIQDLLIYFREELYRSLIFPVLILALFLSALFIRKASF